MMSTGVFALNQILRNRRKDLRFAFGNHQVRASDASTALPIWANGSVKPVRSRLISGGTELLLRMNIVKKLDSAVCAGSDRFHVGQGKWGMMTFNDNRHWVFPLVPTACAYAKLDGYFGKLQTHGGSGEHLEVGGSREKQNQRLMSKWEIPKRLFRK